jgi:hypothetical protein
MTQFVEIQIEGLKKDQEVKVSFKNQPSTKGTIIMDGSKKFLKTDKEKIHLQAEDILQIQNCKIQAKKEEKSVSNNKHQSYSKVVS